MLSFIFAADAHRTWNLTKRILYLWCSRYWVTLFHFCAKNSQVVVRTKSMQRNKNRVGTIYHVTYTTIWTQNKRWHESHRLNSKQIHLAIQNFYSKWPQYTSQLNSTSQKSFKMNQYWDVKFKYWHFKFLIYKLTKWVWWWILVC